MSSSPERPEQLFSAAAELRVLIRTLIGHPGFQVSLLSDRTLVCVGQHDFWAFGHCGHAFGLYTSERFATEAECKACREASVSERFKELFIMAAHAASVAQPTSDATRCKLHQQGGH